MNYAPANAARIAPSNAASAAPGATVVNSLDAALAAAGEASEAFLIGGAFPVAYKGASIRKVDVEELA